MKHQAISKVQMSKVKLDQFFRNAVDFINANKKPGCTFSRIIVNFENRVGTDTIGVNAIESKSVALFVSCQGRFGSFVCEDWATNNDCWTTGTNILGFAQVEKEIDGVITRLEQMKQPLPVMFMASTATATPLFMGSLIYTGSFYNSKFVFC